MKKAWKFLLSTIFILIWLFGAAIWAYKNSRSSYFIDEHIFIRRFSYAMQRGELSKLEKMVSIDNDQLEKWQNKSMTFACPILGRGDTVTETLHKDLSSTIDIKVYDFYYSCTLPSQPYQFSIEKIVIQENKGEWEVLEWGKVCETIDRNQFLSCRSK